jgi:hypothetical protein
MPSFFPCQNQWAHLLPCCLAMTLVPPSVFPVPKFWFDQNPAQADDEHTVAPSTARYMALFAFFVAFFFAFFISVSLVRIYLSKLQFNDLLQMGLLCGGIRVHGLAPLETILIFQACGAFPIACG